MNINRWGSYWSSWSSWTRICCLLNLQTSICNMISHIRSAIMGLTMFLLMEMMSRRRKIGWSKSCFEGHRWIWLRGICPPLCASCHPDTGDSKTEVTCLTSEREWTSVGRDVPTETIIALSRTLFLYTRDLPKGFLLLWSFSRANGWIRLHIQLYGPGERSVKKESYLTHEIPG